MHSYVYLPMFCAKLEHVDPEGRTIQEDVYRIPLVFKDIQAAKDCFEDVVSKMKDTRLVEIIQAGWFIPETGRVLACKRKVKNLKEVSKDEEKSVELQSE